MDDQKLEKLKQQIQKLSIEDPASIRIRDHQDLERVMEYIARNKRGIKLVVAEFENEIKGAYRLHKDLVAKRKKWITRFGFETNIQVAELKAKEFHLEQKRLETEQRKKAELKAKLDEEKKRQHLLNLAVKAEERGNNEKAQEYLEQAENIWQVPVVVPQVSKTIKTEAGTTTMRKDVHVEITNPLEVLHAIVRGKLPLDCVEIKTSKIKAHIRPYDHHDDITKLPKEFFEMGVSIQRTYTPYTRMEG